MSGQQAVARPPVAELLEEPQGTWRGLITSHEECIATRRQLSAAPIAELDHEAGQVDEFPYTSEAKQSYAYQLWQAMTDYSDYYEAKDDKSHFQVDRLKALSEIEMEVLAWEVLAAIENAHNGHLGFTKPPAGGDRAKTWSYKSFGTFGARFAAVRDACRTSKSIVYDLTTSRFIQKLAADPAKEINMKIANKVINDRRAHAKRSAAAKSKPPLSERGEEAELDNGGSISAAEQPTPEDDNSKAVGLRPAPKPKAKRIPRQNLNATHGGRVAKATGQRGRKQPSRGAGALAGSHGNQVPDPPVLPAVAAPVDTRGGLHQMLLRPLQAQERDPEYQRTVKDLLTRMGNQGN